MKTRPEIGTAALLFSGPGRPSGAPARQIITLTGAAAGRAIFAELSRGIEGAMRSF